MGLYNFQPRFVPFILANKKTHTIRAVRAHPDKPGNTLHLYTGLRTKKAKLLMRVPCVKVEDIWIEAPKIIHAPVPFARYDVWHDTWFPLYCAVTIDGHELDYSEKDQLARRDGFSSFQEMLNFWTRPKNRLPFLGHIIHWREL
jgi:hypothetical protein